METKYYPLGTNGTRTLLKVELITGRAHQIRAHLASEGHSIVGDPKYGKADKKTERTAASFFSNGVSIYERKPVIFIREGLYGTASGNLSQNTKRGKVGGELL